MLRPEAFASELRLYTPRRWDRGFTMFHRGRTGGRTALPGHSGIAVTPTRARLGRCVRPAGAYMLIVPCRVLGELRSHHFSTLLGGPLSGSVSRLPVSGGDLRARS